MKLKLGPLTATLLSALVFVLTTGCGTGRTQSAQAATKEQPKQDLFSVNVSSALDAQIQVGAPKLEDVAKPFRAAGRIQADETHLARVSSPVTGRVSEIRALEGDHVRRGQVLATINSTELSNIQLTYLEACSRRQLAEKAVARAELLLKADVIGSAELIRRQAELQEKIEEVSASQAQLDVLGMSEQAVAKLTETRTINSVSHIVASVTGTVLERKATLGQVVPPSEPVFVIADLSQVWLIADVPEESAGDLRAGKSVRADILAFPGEVVSGKLAFVSPIVSPDTRTVRIRMNLPNPRGRYKPDMLATVSLTDATQKKLVVPSSALVREDNKNYVFVQRTSHEFRLQEVTLGADLESRHEVAGGLDSVTKIALTGAFHLNNERKRQALSGGE